MTKRILIVEDDVGIQAITKYSLEMETDWQIVAAFNGREGLFKARNLHLDVILLDLVMPDIDGYEMLRELQSDRATKQIPIILFTAKVVEADSLKSNNCQIKGTIIKPFDCLDIAAKIAEILNWQCQPLSDRFSKDLTEKRGDGEKSF